MTTKIEDRDTAARHIDATEIAPDVWVYLPSEVNRHYTVTSEDLATLGRDLRVGAPDAYSLWCSVCGDESTPYEIAEYYSGNPLPQRGGIDVQTDRRAPVPKPDMDADLRTGLVEFTIEIDRRSHQ